MLVKRFFVKKKVQYCDSNEAMSSKVSNDHYDNTVKEFVVFIFFLPFLTQINGDRWTSFMTSKMKK